MKILMISSSSYPIPAIKGGAVETLVTDFVNENEKFKKIQLDVVTRYDKDAKVISDKYEYTKVLAKKFEDSVLYRFLKKFNSKSKNSDSNLKKKIQEINAKNETNMYNKWIIKILKKHEKEYDFIIVEGGDIYGYEPIYKYIPREKAMFHIHGRSSGSKFASEKFGTFLAVSQYIKNELIQAGNINEKDIELLYNGVELSNFQKTLTDNEKKEIKNKYGIRENEKVIVFCGRTIPEKGVKELLLAFKNIYNRCNAKLLIIGNSGFANTKVTDYDKELYEISKDFKDRIVFTGHVYNKELYRYYNISDIAVFPHTCKEAFGLVLVEAMAAGKPIITTKAGAIPEVVSDECGILLQYEDREKMVEELSKNMFKLINDEEMCKRMAEKARANIQRFSATNYYKNFIKILENKKEELKK